MLSRRILTIIGICLGVCAWFGLWHSDNRFMIPLGIFIVLGILTYTFQHQIDWWSTNKKIPQLDSSMRQMLLQTNPFYSQLSEEDREKFEQRMVLWVQSKEFIMQASNSIPEDLKYAVAAYAVMVTFHREDYLLEGIDRVAFYPHVFLTPQFADDVHACEVELEDGIFIFAIQQMMHGHLKPRQYYNIVLHTMAEAIEKKYGRDDLPQIPEDFWPKLDQISNIRKERIEAFIGLPLSDPWPMALHHYFIYPDHFQEHAPDVFNGIKEWHENIVLTA